MAQSALKVKVERPSEVSMFEEELGIKFKPLYHDGLEWDALLPAKGGIDFIEKITALGQWLEQKGFTKTSYNALSTICLKVKPGVDLSIEPKAHGWQVSLYFGR